MFPRDLPCLRVTACSLLVLGVLPPAGWGQQAAIKEADLAPILSFEASPSGFMPGGWGGGPPATIFLDNKIVHSGRGAVRIERGADSEGAFSTVTKSIPMDFSGSAVELKGFVRTENVSNFVGLWMREDGESPTLAFDNMQNAQLKGTTDWKEYSIKLPVVPEAKQLFFGFLLAGTGKAWADDLELLVDGKPVWEAPHVEHPQTVLDRDHQFDGGSGIVLKGSLTPVQIDNLVLLGRVWGFLKYHHPKVTAGQIHWDYELFRVMPAVLDAPDHASANATLARWIDGLGPVAPCNPCAKLNEHDIYYRPDLDWISNGRLLGDALRARLLAIYHNRGPGKQYYVSRVADVGNPKFEHELGYESSKFPDPGLQLLGLYRFWNIVEYWSPYRDIIGEDWTQVLAEFIPKIAEAPDIDAYTREMLAMIARLHDGHANLWTSLDKRPPVGKCVLPVTLRFVEGHPVVSRITAEEKDPVLKLGDAITGLDGVPVAKLAEGWKPYYAASNDIVRMRDMANSMTRGQCGPAKVGVHRDGRDLELSSARVAPPSSPFPGTYTHDLPGPAFRLLSKDVAYLKLSAVKAADAAYYVEQAAETKGLIIDIRNYPSEFVVFALGSLLVDKETAFVRFTECDLANPGAFHWGQPLSLAPAQPHYSGKVVILVDEVSVSQAEYTTMAFRAAPRAIVVGSTTAGADGNVSPFALPGGLRTMISGISVFYPDKAPTQRVGIVPNIEVKPTIAGIRAGRDEVLEEALRQILGRETPAAEIEKISHPAP